MNSRQRRQSARHWKYHVEYNYDWQRDYDEPMEWCRTNVGRKGWDWCVSFYYGVFQFKELKSANWFRLRWVK